MNRFGQIALVVAATLLAVVVAEHAGHREPDVGGARALALIVLAIVPLALAGRWPAVAAAVSTLATVVLVHDYVAPVAVASFGITLVLLAHLVIRRGLEWAALLLIPFVVFAVARLQDGRSALVSTAPLLFLIAALAVGESVRRRRVAIAALDATQEAMAESVRAQTVLEERARIARELHDIVAHHLSVIAVESEAARLTSPKLSKDVSKRLEAIAATAREALTETRRLLGVLREDTGGQADRSPQPGLLELDELIDKAQTAGTPIRFIRQGTIAQLPQSVDLAAYRIVQEALTNARRHAPGADVEVELSYRDQALNLRVRDYGPGTDNGEPAEGHGLLGMRERAALAGGTFSAGPAAGGGFEVAVMLPIATTAP